MIYAAITYIAWGMIYTASDVPFWSLPNALTPNADERGSIISKARTANGVGSAVPMAIFMILGFVLPNFNLSGTELEKTKYTVMALVSSIIGNLLFVSVYFKTKERVVIPNPPKRDKTSRQRQTYTHLQAVNAYRTYGHLSSGKIYVSGRRSSRCKIFILYRKRLNGFKHG